MKILHVISSIDPEAGGVSQALRTMIIGLTAEGHESEVVCLDTKGKLFLNESFTITALGPTKTPWLYSKKLLPWLKENIQRFDTVLVHGLWQYHTYCVRKAWKKTLGRKPSLFLMPHGMLDPYFQKAEGRKLKAIRNWIFWRWTESKIVNVADVLLFTCEMEMLLARTTFSGYHPKRERVIGLGVERPPVYVKEIEESFLISFPEVKNNNYYLFISRLHEKKGVDILIRAYLALAHKYILPKLVIAGPGEATPYGKEMIKMAAANRDIIFTGMLSGEVKWGAFYGCEAFILPSHQENFGIAVVEALACGKPALISNQVNIWKEVEDLNAGLVEADTFEGAYKMMEEWILMKEDQKTRIREQTQIAFESKFSVTEATKRLINVVRELNT